MMKKSFPLLLSLLTLLLVPFKVFAIDLTTIQEKVTDYLPYILIGGAVILLISIIGILLGKKKDKNVSSEPVEMTQPANPEVKAPVMEQIPEATPAVNMDTISNNLYSPTPEVAPEKPSIQDTLGAAPQPIPTDNTQSSDLQDILQGEAAAAPMTPVTDQTIVPEPVPVVEQPAPVPVVENAPVPPIDTTSNTVPDLQQFVNNQVAEVPPMAAPVAEPTPNSADTAAPASTGTPASI